MKYKELTTKNLEQLQIDLKDKRNELADLEIKKRSGAVKNTKQISALKKDIARVLTAITALK